MDHPADELSEINAEVIQASGFEHRTLALGAGRARAALAEAWVQAHGNDSPHTAARYGRDIATFFRWADEHDYDVFKMIPWHIDQYRRWLQTAEHVGRYRNTRKLSHQTVSGRIAAVSSFYRYCRQNTSQLMHMNPAEEVKRPRVSRESRTLGLSADEVDALREVARARGAREYALIQLLLGTGLRISEVTAADTGDLVRDGDAWYLEVTRKGGERELVEVPAATVRSIQRYLNGRAGSLFLGNNSERMTRRQAAHWIGAMARSAGVTKRISPHSIRHTVATLALDAGVSLRDLQVLLGHKSTETTARYDRARRNRNNPASRALAVIVEDDTNAQRALNEMEEHRAALDARADLDERDRDAYSWEDAEEVLDAEQYDTASN